MSEINRQIFKSTVEHGNDIFFHANLIRRMNCGIINPLLYHLFLCSLDIKETKKEDYNLFKDIASSKTPISKLQVDSFRSSIIQNVNSDLDST
jgi:hypothetical protein